MSLDWDPSATVVLGYIGGTAGVVGLVIHTMEAVRLSERRPLRMPLVAAGFACALAAAILGSISAAILHPRLDAPMLPVALTASLALGVFYGHSVRGLLKQRAISLGWQVAFTCSTVVLLAFGMFDIWLTTTAMVLWR